MTRAQAAERTLTAAGIEALMASGVYPAGHASEHDLAAPAALTKSRKQKARAIGGWVPHLPSAPGRMGAGLRPYGCMNEIHGRGAAPELRSKRNDGYGRTS